MVLEPIDGVPVAAAGLVQPLLVIFAVGEVLVEHALCVVAQLGQAQLVVRQVDDVQGLFGNGNALKIGDDCLRPIDCGHVGAAFIVVLGNVYFVLCNGTHQPGDAFFGVGGIAAVGIAQDELIKRFVVYGQVFRHPS